MAHDRKVYLVGAGPGDPGLITVKGAELIGRADVVVYDFLANRRLLDRMKEGAEAVCVGKRPGKHTKTQEETSQLLVDLWREGKEVVRLKGGDPFVFGRGGEEALALAEAGVPFEVVPGVTAGIAGLAYAGIPATHRGLAVSTTLATGHEDPTKEEARLDLKALAACRGTLIFYMGVRNLAATVKGLVEGGLPPDTPAALVYMATTAEQQVVTSTLKEIAAAAKASGIEPPAVLAVGKVVDLRPKLSWFENLPLFGKKVVITRPREQASRQREALEALGAEVIEFPAISILPAEDYGELDGCIEKLGGFDLVIFTSVNGVRFFFQRMEGMGYDVRKLAGRRVCAIGPGTTAALESRGLRADLVPPRYTSSALVPAMVEAWKDVKGKRALLPRADIAPKDLLKRLEEAGIAAKEVTAYRTVPAEGDREEVRRMLEAGEIHAVTFASSSAAKSFVEAVGRDLLARCRSKVKLISIGPVTTQTLKDHGLPPDSEAEEHTIPGLIEETLKTGER